MRNYPILDDIPKSREMMQAFGGYNHNLRIPEGEFDDMKNMSSSFYPVLSPRGKRGIFTQLTDPNGLFAKTKLVWVDGTSLYYNGVLVNTTSIPLTDSAKQFVSMGAYLLIWPDKVCYNTKTQEYFKLEASITTSTDVVVTLAKQDGTAYPAPFVSATEPEDPEADPLWMDTSSSPHVLKQWSAQTSMWVAVPTTYVKIAATNIGKQFANGDGVTISGLTNATLNGSFVLQGTADDYIIVTAIIDAGFEQTAPVTVKREIPSMDFLCESGNRVWGCSSDTNMVYACKLGDPKNWFCFQGVATDSYNANLGSDGKFTGAVAYRDEILFFKEDIIHRFYGTAPSNFVRSDIVCRGVERGSEKSLVVLNERLYYKARNGICVYDGAIPTDISGAFGSERYKNAVGGAFENKYYVSMKDTSGAWHLFAYDTVRGLWHREDSTQAMQFATHEGELFYIDATTKKIMTVGGRLTINVDTSTKYDPVGALEGDVQWYVETGDIGMDMPDNKYVSQLLFRLEVDVEKTISIEFKFDSAGSWVKYDIPVKTPKRTVSLPFYLQRCDHLRMRISGTGPCKIYSITKTIEQGSDV